jgi:hypothetical protein
MKKLIVAALLGTIATTSYASTKLTYTKAELEASNANSVLGIINRYVTDTGRTTLIAQDKVLFLLDGRPVAEADDHLPSSDRVEVLTDGDSVIINVVTKPAASDG